MSNTINENITKRILHEELMKLVCEEETPVATENDNLTSFLKKEDERPIQQYKGTWIYAQMHIGKFDHVFNRILFHTKKDYNSMEYVHKTFPLFSGVSHINYVDFIFNLDTLTDITDNKIWLNSLSIWYIIPESIVNSLIPEMKKWNEDTIKRNKISQMFKSTFESVGRRVESMQPRQKK